MRLAPELTEFLPHIMQIVIPMARYTAMKKGLPLQKTEGEHLVNLSSYTYFSYMSLHSNPVSVV